ncbi:hypothetical protein ACP70R_035955 [Stipagrostis hirtigluma subsp. patula]
MEKVELSPQAMLRETLRQLGLSEPTYIYLEKQRETMGTGLRFIWKTQGIIEVHDHIFTLIQKTRINHS